jgi:hypothetical protein
MRMYVSLAAAAAVATGLSFGATNAEAGVIMTVTAAEEGWQQNDCAGEFGAQFENCQVANSYVIAKYDIGDDAFTINNARFPSVDENDFDVWEDPEGTWNWTFDNDEVLIYYWVAKVGAAHESGGFTLHWYVESATGVCDKEAATWDLDGCLALALAVTSGQYVAGAGPGAGLSHLTWYDTPVPVPLPAGLLLFLTGLAGVGFLGRYKAKRREPELV